MPAESNSMSTDMPHLIISLYEARGGRVEAACSVSSVLFDVWNAFNLFLCDVIERESI